MNLFQKTKKKFCDTFPSGISDDHICARGIKKVKNNKKHMHKEL